LLIFLNIILLILSGVCFLVGYAFLTNKAEDILMSKKVTDKEGYTKQQGKISILSGIIFLLVPVSLYFVENFNLNKELLYLWIIVIAGVVMLNAVKVRRYFK